jgi:hypothetical protein
MDQAALASTAACRGLKIKREVFYLLLVVDGDVTAA